MTANWKNRTIWTSDNLVVMRGMNSDSVDLIYLDPPFNSNHNYAAPIGSKAAGAEFKDTWTLTDIDIEWHGIIAESHPKLYGVIRMAGDVYGKSVKAYLIYMAIRVIEMHRILKDSASIYLHCDTTASHYLKIMLDSVFGKANFQNEIIWSYKSGGASPKRFAKKHDIILLYSKTERHVFNALKEKSYNQDLKPCRFNDAEEFEDEVGWHTLVDMRDVWDLNMIGRTSKERTGYPTQKPLALLYRIIEASSNKNDMVFDPFCGCATTLVAANGLDRNWVGIDVSPLATKLVVDRIHQEQGELFGNIIARTDVPARTDTVKVKKYNTPENKNLLYGKQDGLCNGCNIYFLHRNMTIDHKMPRAKGGGDNIENLQLLCGACNSSKGNKTEAEWRAHQKQKVTKR